MRGEHFGFRRDGRSLLIVDADQMPDELLSRVERFRFPTHEFASEHERQKEIEIDRMYHRRSTYLLSLSPKDDFSFVAVARIIAKRNPEEKLPIEFGIVTSVTDGLGDAPVIMNPGEPLRIVPKPEFLPACEAGGLRAADPNPDLGITMRSRYEALDAVLKASNKEGKIRGFRIGFLTCLARLNLQHLYQNRYSFHEAGEVRYGTEDRWKALWRWV